MTAAEKPVPPALHELESEVMEQVWEREEATVRDVLEALNSGRKQRAYTTIMTIMARLDEKGLLQRRKRGKTHVYRPAMSREEYLEARAQSEVDGLVADYGDLALAHFARQLGTLDPKRRRQLRELAEES
jgi:BlaI family transcriptional regulator, penicillinase repressor